MYNSDLYFPLSQLWMKLVNIWDYETSRNGLGVLILLLTPTQAGVTGFCVYHLFTITFLQAEE